MKLEDKNQLSEHLEKLKKRSEIKLQSYDKYLNLLETARTVKEMPAKRYLWDPKFHPFLKTFKVNEVKEIQCSDRNEADKMASRIRISAGRIFPLQFKVTSRRIGKEYFVYVQRLEDGIGA